MIQNPLRRLAARKQKLEKRNKFSGIFHYFNYNLRMLPAHISLPVIIKIASFFNIESFKQQKAFLI